MTCWADHLLILVIALVFPIYTVVTYPAFKREIASGRAGARLLEYSTRCCSSGS